jgi:signal transduction histidine kinase
MIEGVLHYSSLNASQQMMEEVDLNVLIEQIQEDLEVLIRQKKAAIQVNKLVVIEGASVLLYQLFYNLVNNSLKFTRPGIPPLIKIYMEPVDPSKLSSDPKQYVIIKVADNGIGFEQKNADSIFETFTRLNSKDKFEGTGLGLTLCKKIAERHGGSITAEGKEGEGAIFTIRLPMKQP